jgi:hypothetical protein
MGNNMWRATFQSGILFVAMTPFVSALPMSNNSSWEAYFPDEKLENKKIIKLIKELKGYEYVPGQRQPLVKSLAAFGGEVVPYMLKLAGDRRKAVFGGMESGVLVTQSPYTAAAAEVIAQIEDKGAIPNLKKILSSRLLGGKARKRLVELGAQFDAEEARRIIEHDRMGVIVNPDDYLYIGKFLPVEERAEVFMWFIRSGAIIPGRTLDNVNDLRHFAGFQTLAALKIIRFLGDTGSPAARQLISSQHKNLKKTIAGAGTNVYNEGAAKKLMEEYELALSKLDESK